MFTIPSGIVEFRPPFNSVLVEVSTNALQLFLESNVGLLGSTSIVLIYSGHNTSVPIVVTQEPNLI